MQQGGRMGTTEKNRAITIEPSLPPSSTVSMRIVDLSTSHPPPSATLALKLIFVSSSLPRQSPYEMEDREPKAEPENDNPTVVHAWQESLACLPLPRVSRLSTIRFLWLPKRTKKAHVETCVSQTVCISLRVCVGVKVRVSVRYRISK